MIVGFEHNSETYQRLRVFRDRNQGSHLNSSPENPMPTPSKRGSWTGSWQSFFLFPCSDPSGFGQAPAASSLFCDWCLNCFLFTRFPVSYQILLIPWPLCFLPILRGFGELSQTPHPAVCARQHILFLRTHTHCSQQEARGALGSSSSSELPNPPPCSHFSPLLLFFLLSILLSLTLLFA